MAIKFHKKFKDKKNRKNFVQVEKKIRYLKFMKIKYQKLAFSSNFYEKTKALIFLKKLQVEAEKIPHIRITNYCILTGRARGVYRDFKLSRHQIKQNFKFLTGLRNSSF